MNALTLIGSDLIGSLTALSKLTPRVRVTRALADFAGIHADTYKAIGRVSSALTEAAYGHGQYPGSLSAADFAVLEQFVAHLRSDFALAGITIPDEATDKQHSPDESHYLDRERL